MTVAVVRFGGSNCDRDAVRALAHLGVDAAVAWHDDGLPADTDGVVVPGGFSYGDYLRAGAMAAQSPVVAEVRALAADGVPVLGVCNGAQIGCEAGLAPGAFTTNASARFQCERVHLRVENATTPWTAAYSEGDVLEIPIAHGEDASKSTTTPTRTSWPTTACSSGTATPTARSPRRRTRTDRRAPLPASRATATTLRS